MLHLSKVSRSGTTRQKGLSAIEFTLALPFMLLMFSIFVEFGRIYIQQTTLTKAVQDGARYAVSGDVSESDFYDQVKNFVVYGRELEPTDPIPEPILPGLNTTIVNIDTSDADYVSVEVTYTYSPLLLNTPQFEDDGIFSGLNNLNKLIGLPLSASSVMRKSL